MIALSLVRNLGSRMIHLLLEEFTSPADILSSQKSRLREVEGLGAVTAENIAGFNRWQEVDAILHDTRRADARLVSILDPAYPPLLRQIYDPPPILWIRGNEEALSVPGVAVIGTRRPSRYGRNQVESWTQDLVGSGLAIMSGLANGIDTAAHREAVDNQGTTAAILGSGIDRVYPFRNRGLASRIIGSGGVVATEFPPGTQPLSHHFPRRNRIVSGLSLGVLVIQSGITGGSMITARVALDQNREVFVLPFSLGEKSGEGNNYLIQSGQGKLVRTLEDILVELPCRHIVGRSGQVKNQQKPAVKSLGPTQQKICNTLSEGRLQINALADRTGTTAMDLLPVLLELEMDDRIIQHAGKYFELK